MCGGKFYSMGVYFIAEGVDGASGILADAIAIVFIQWQ